MAFHYDYRWVYAILSTFLFLIQINAVWCNEQNLIQRQQQFQHQIRKQLYNHQQMHQQSVQIDDPSIILHDTFNDGNVGNGISSSSSVIGSEMDTIMPSHGRCEPITISICLDIPYNMTIMPNIFGQTAQEEASIEVYQFAPLVKIDCSPDLQFFLCLLYVPVCTILDEPIPPCRSLCESARACEGIMRSFDFEWPENLECSRFPEDDGVKLCVAENATATATPTPTSYNTPKIQSPRRNFNNNNNDNHNNNNGLQTIGGGGGGSTGHHRNLRFKCPIQLKAPSGLGYVLNVGGEEIKNCGAPCHAMFFAESERTVLRYWVGSWAALCCASCLFTVLTFLIDPSRFRYPERAIVFLAVCYLIVGCAYVAGLGAGDSVSCREPFPPPVKMGRLQMVSTITQGHRQSTSCTLLFMALYFCCMAAFAWWACLALAWFLAAGLKWGHEAIENKSHLFHLFAWAIPALQTISVIALGKVEGDVLSGVCFVGHLDTHSLGVFLLFPLCVYLSIGALFLLAGFISLFRIRTVMKTDGKRTDKLERLMLRIGFFSGLFILPAIGFLGCLFYEYYYFNDWMLQWNQDMCKIFSIPCPNSLNGENRPIFQIFMAKYVCSMLVGVTSSVWLYSSKTVISWRMFIERIQGTNSRTRGQAYV